SASYAHHLALHSFPTTTLFRSQRIEQPFVPGLPCGERAAVVPVVEEDAGVVQPRSFSFFELPEGIGLGTCEVARLVAFVAVHGRSEEHTSELQSRENLVCRLLL